MRREYDAIVVGGGIAGLTCAAYLCQDGYRTLLCEKRKKTGGLVDTFWHKGFAFDAGIRAFENSGMLKPMLRELGILLELIPDEVTIGVGEERVCLRTRDSLDDYISMLQKLFPAETLNLKAIREEIYTVMGYMEVLYGIDNPLFVREKDLSYLRNTLLPWLIKYERNVRKATSLDEPIRIFLSRFTANAALVDMITQHFFKNTPTFFALGYFNLYLDYSYPRGGTGMLAEKLTQQILSFGGEIRTGTEILSVDAADHLVKAAQGETFSFDKLIWAADLKTLYRITKGVESRAFEKQKDLVSQSSGGDSILTIFLGIDLGKEFFEERHSLHLFYTPHLKGLTSLPPFLPQGATDSFQWVGDFLERTTYEISCPVMRDKSLAPEGQSGLIISTLMDCEVVRHFAAVGEYQRLKQFCTSKIIQLLDDSIYPGLKQKILFSICSTPLTIENEISSSEGAITGWAFTESPCPAEHRFTKITHAFRTPIPDVYQCGQWSFSPSGLPVSILTGKIAANEVQKTVRSPRRKSYEKEVL